MTENGTLRAIAFLSDAIGELKAITKRTNLDQLTSLAKAAEHSSEAIALIRLEAERVATHIRERLKECGHATDLNIEA
ncbi:MAG: hypothetical protein ACE5IP_11950 [Terriglobia bacterium]